MSRLMEALFLIVLAAPLAAAWCEGSDCKVDVPEDETSLLQMTLDVDRHENVQMTNTTLYDTLDGTLGGIRRERDADACAAILQDKHQDLCFLSGGNNPKISNGAQYGTKAWKEVFKSLPASKCKFCGVRGQYASDCEGSIMLYCNNQEPDLQGMCRNAGKKLGQDTVLERNSGVAQFIVTTAKGNLAVGDTDKLPPCDNDGKRYDAIFDPVPVPYTGGALSSKIAKGDPVVFVLAANKDCVQGDVLPCKEAIPGGDDIDR